MPLRTFFQFTDTDDDEIAIAITVLFAIIVVLLIIIVALCVIVKRFRKHNRKRRTAASGEMTVQSPNDVPTNFVEKKVKLTLTIKSIKY